LENKRMRALIDEINAHNYRYYVLDEPSVSDGEYDKLYDELRALEVETGVVMPDSPTRRVGGEPVKGFLPHTHLSKLYSLDKCTTADGLRDFDARIKRTQADPLYSVEYKLDGLTICLTYENGLLRGAATRGNGEVGEDVTAQVMTIRSVPAAIPYRGLLEVQGEGIMRLSAFEAYNRTAAEPLKNARNGVAGAIRSLDPAVAAARKLDIIFYHVNYIEGDTLKSQSECLSFLRENRFKTQPTFVSGDIERVIGHVAGIERNKLDFLIDGMVVKLEDFAARRALGFTDKFPRWAIAYKFEAEEATTTLSEVVFNVGRTGKLTPLALVEPVELYGVTVRRATLNNMGDIERKNVRVGGRVFIRRSNDVIPEILGAADDKGARIEAPAVCPACGSPLVTVGAHLFCENEEGCPPQITGRIEHYASKDGMDLVGISEKTIAALHDRLGVRSVADLYLVTEEQLRGLEGFKDKKTGQFFRSLERSKRVPLHRFVHALGIENVGKKTARDLAAHYKTMEKLMDAEAAELVGIEDVGDIVAASVIGYFEKHRPLIQRLFAYGVRPQPVTQAESAADSPYAGKKLVVTGTVEGYGRKELEELIRGLGAKPQASVSKETDLLIYGENAGSKLEKARELAVETMAAAQFLTSILDRIR
jgi:DNA ligase (NAD+)